MNTLLKDLKFTKVYIDDILVATKTLDEHKDELKRLLTILRTNGVKISMEKSCFFMDEIDYLGCNINSEGIVAKIDKDRILDIKPPKTKKQCKKLTGFINWYRPYVFNLSEQTAYLYEKHKGKGHNIQWSSEDSKKLETIKQNLLDIKRLSFPDYSKPFTLKCDASDMGAGSILLQEEKIIGLFSRKFNETEQLYTTPEKEMYSIYLALQHFRPYLFGAKFEVHTDS